LRCAKPNCKGEAVAFRAKGVYCAKHSNILTGKITRPENMRVHTRCESCDTPMSVVRVSTTCGRCQMPAFVPSAVLQQEHCVWLIERSKDEESSSHRPCNKPMAVLDMDGQPLCKVHARA
jgi:hypothetical protein